MNDFPDFSHYGYQLEKELGHNRAGGRVTYLATDIRTQQAVVIKQFQFAKTGASWSEFDAYDREIQLLKELDHPGIPRYLDSFQTADGFCMAQEYKKSVSLAVARSFNPQIIQHIAIAPFISQSSNCNPSTRSNSRVLCVTRVRLLVKTIL